MPYSLFFPFSIQHNGLFRERSKIIDHFKKKLISNDNIDFRESLPTIQEVSAYTQILAKDNLSQKYIGDLLSYTDSWRPVAGFADLDNLSKGLNAVVDQHISNSYFMTNTAGHHADNIRYELFCPFNQLFFMVETLNYIDNFPEILWIDIDAHFGNGDKILFDLYNQKMHSENNNLHGVSLHTDFGMINENQYKGVAYNPQIGNDQFLDLLQNSFPANNTYKYILLFFGTDIFAGDYGGNSTLTPQLIPQILNTVEQFQKQNNSQLIIVQTGGEQFINIETLIGDIVKK